MNHGVNTDWESLVRMEPALLVLEQSTTLAETLLPRDFCANVYWSRVVKPLMSDIVGWRRNPRRSDPNPDVTALLRPQWAYDTATRHLYECLPACQACGCISLPGVPRGAA